MNFKYIIVVILLFFQFALPSNRKTLPVVLKNTDYSTLHFEYNKDKNNSLVLKNSSNSTVTQNNLLFRGVYRGGLLVLLVGNLIFFFTLRRRSYFLFSGVVLFFLLALLASDFQALSLKLIFSLFTFSLFTLLLGDLLGAKEFFATLYKISRFIAPSYALLSFPSFFSESYVLFMEKFFVWIFLFFAFSICIFSLFSLQKKLAYAKYFLPAGIFLLADGLILFFLTKNNSTLLLFFTTGSFLAILTVAFSLLLNFINELKDSQQQIILKLEEMNEFKEKMNLELEQKVKKRTHELESANELLNYQNKEIEAIVQNLADANEQILEQKELIEDTHLKMTESINSASHIQAAMLPKTTVFSRYFEEFFILYKPRDIVSGDFYWIKRLGNQIVLCAADCTGHGVPGAFVSMLGISLLTEIVRKKEAKTPATMLDELRTSLKLSLRQKGRENELKEGIDLVLCIINTDTKLMEFAGANNSMYIIRPNSVGNQQETPKVRINEKLDENTTENMFIEIKGNHQPIGAYRKERPFSNQTVQLYAGDTLYLFTDGFVDQFGGDKGYKFRTRPFKNYLLSIQEASLEEQQLLLDEKFNQWKGNHRQLDDVLIMGIRIA